MADMKPAIGLLLLAAAPVQAADLTMKMGETWVFALKNNQPANAHKVAANSKPPNGQVRATVSTLGGTTMTLTNATGIAYTFKAELIGRDGKSVAARSCALPANDRPIFESWTQVATAIRIGDFKPSGDEGRC